MSYFMLALFVKFVSIYPETLMVMDSNVVAIQRYMIAEQLESNLRQEAFIYNFSSIFDTPSFFYALPFLIVGTQSTRTVPLVDNQSLSNSADNQSFSRYHYWTMIIRVQIFVRCIE